MLKEQKNSRKQGDVGLGAAINWFTKNGWTVCIPLTDNQSYDLVVENNSGLKKVQVKTTYFKTKYGVYSVNLKVFGGNRSRQTIKKFDSTLVDFLFILTEDGEQYLIPTNVILATNAINLNKDREKYKV